MKTFSIMSSLLFIFSGSLLQAQEILYHEVINKTNVNLRDSATILARIDAFIPVAGDVILRFDGVCYSSPGDRIILAANNGPFWQVNYGNVGVETTDENFGKSFSHSTTLNYYEQDAGKVHSLYAIGQNWGNQNGNGHASIYGELTAELLPYTGPAYAWDNGNTFNGDVTNPTIANQVTAHAFSPGKIIVRLDGWCMSDVGDRIILAASNTTNWGPDDGNVSVEATSSSNDVNTFSHTREYDVPAAGDYIYYGIVQNAVETDGNGMVWVYSHLHAEFYPNSGSTLVAFKGFSKPQEDLNDHFETLTSVSLNAPGPGTVLVDLDGELISDAGDFIELGASDNLMLPENDGNILLHAIDDDLNRNSFAHSRVYTVGAGQHTFYALGKSFSNNSGSGIADVYGELVARFFPDQNTAVHDEPVTQDDFSASPNPTSGIVTISFDSDIHPSSTIGIFNETGYLLRSYSRNYEKTITLDLSSFQDGMYMVEAGKTVKRIIKLN